MVERATVDVVEVFSEITQTVKIVAAQLHPEETKNAFINLKDHKENFQNNPTCRLGNPIKSEIVQNQQKVTRQNQQRTAEKTTPTPAATQQL